MRYILAVAVLTAFSTLRASAQSDAKLPELPTPAGQEPTMPAIPAPTSTYNAEPDKSSATPTPVPPPRPMTEEEIARLKQDENWLVEGMKKKQEEDAARQEKLKQEEPAKKNDANENTVLPGELSGFKPVLSGSSLASLNQSPNAEQNPNATKKNNSLVLPGALPNANSTTGTNPLKSTNTGTIQPILGPNRQTGMSENVANLNPGLGIAPLPQTGVKKLSSNTNFVPEGYADSWTKQQQQSSNPYKNLAPQAQKPVAPVPPAAPRPTFRDLTNTIPDPTQVR